METKVKSLLRDRNGDHQSKIGMLRLWQEPLASKAIDMAVTQKEMYAKISRRMSRKLRIFVSSTMKDLANERDAICARLRSFNFEPVNAEGWSPTGGGTWARISQEIESSDVFLLLIGESYGWIPTVGPKADSGLSVTHLEYRQADDQKLPILPFLKKLTYDTDHTSEDARKRDAFRAEVSGWSAGQFVGSFELASDLADSAGRALIELLTEDFVSSRIRERAKTVEATTRILSEQLGSGIAPEIVIPPHLVEAVKRRKVILFAGSGISQSAGLPSAAALGEYLARDLRDQPEYARGAGAAAFGTVATDVALYAGRDYLADQVVRVLDPPLGVQPTIAHKWSVLLLDLILTTNWDNLFEAAAADQEQVFHVVTSELDHEPSGRAILKLHGSVRDPRNLLLTEIDIVKMDTLRPKLWRWARHLLSSHTVLVVGSSLRDPSTIRLLSGLPRSETGYFVGPRKSGMFDARLRVWNLTGLAADPDAFFAQLGELVSQ